MNLNHKRRSVERAEAFKKRVKRNDDLQSAVKVSAILATVASMRQVLINLPGETELYTLDRGLRKQVVRYFRDCTLRGVGSVKKVAHNILAGWKRG